MDLQTTTPISPLASYEAALEKLAGEGQLRRCRVVTPSSENSTAHQSAPLSPDEPDRLPMNVLVEGQPAINFSSNDYLGLAHDERLKEAAIEAIRTEGTGSSASRLISGTSERVIALEQTLAAFKQTEAALVFNSGYQANVAILQALLEPGDWVFCDKLNHASLVDGCLLSGARWTRYRHLDLAHLEEKLKKAPTTGRLWIVTDSVFSMDGDYPDLPALVDLADRYNALLMVDEAHATGLFGENCSSGLCEHFGVSHRVALQMGTFSKALGGAGAYVAGSKILIDTLVNKARGFVYSTALPPATIATAQRSIEVVQSDTRLKNRLWENISHFETRLREAGLAERIALPVKSPIIPVLIGDSNETIRVSQALLEEGFFVQGIRPPTVPPGTARLRIALSALHTQAQLEALVRSLAKCLRDNPLSA